MRWPVDKVRVTGKYGDRVIFGKKDFHTGIDFGGAMDTPIKSFANGVVKHVGNDPDGFGKYVVVEHAHLKMCSMYNHLNNTCVKIGDEIEAGTPVGGMGTTGRSTGVHLHFEIRPVLYRRFWDKTKIYGASKPKHYVDPTTIIK